MSGELILVVHPRDEVLDSLSETLHGAGFKVMSAASAQGAVESFAGSRFFMPDAVLTPIDADDPAGSPLIERVRSNPLAEQVPVVVLANGNPAERRHALRLGLNHVILPPYDGEEVVLSTRLALEQHRDERLLSGSLAQMSPVELLQSAELNRRSGTIVLKHRGKVATVWLREGRVVDAEVDDGRRREEAVYAMATWDEGTFEANFGPVSMPQRINSSTTSLLLEAMRRRDESVRDAAADSPPHAALDDPPPPPPRPLLVLHRSLTLLNMASSYAGDHLDLDLLRSRMQAVRDRLLPDHALLAAFRVNDRGQVHLEGDDPGLDRVSPDRVVQGTAAWVRELFHDLDHALPGRFPLSRLRAISEAVQDDLDRLGFYRELGFESDAKETA